MRGTARKSSSSYAVARRRAAKKAAQVGKLLQSFAEDLTSLDDLTKTANPAPTPRNWWRLQSGRFKDDASFPGFVARVQANRKQAS